MLPVVDDGWVVPESGTVPSGLRSLIAACAGDGYKFFKDKHPDLFGKVHLHSGDPVCMADLFHHVSAVGTGCTVARCRYKHVSALATNLQ